MTEKKEVQLFTDGACSGNPGPGGWGAILRYKGQEKELSGGEPMTTNNRMELLAAIEGLSALKQPCRVILTSDSKYLVDAVTKGWVNGWQKKGWRKSDNSPALNVDLWERLLPLLTRTPTPTSSRSPLTMRASTTNPSRSTGAS